jgi:hypothetical protein
LLPETFYLERLMPASTNREISQRGSRNGFSPAVTPIWINNSPAMSVDEQRLVFETILMVE